MWSMNVLTVTPCSAGTIVRRMARVFSLEKVRLRGRFRMTNRKPYAGTNQSCGAPSCLLKRRSKMYWNAGNAKNVARANSWLPNSLKNPFIRKQGEAARMALLSKSFQHFLVRFAALLPVIDVMTSTSANGRLHLTLRWLLPSKLSCRARLDVVVVIAELRNTEYFSRELRLARTP